jgi:hypothetical protein
MDTVLSGEFNLKQVRTGIQGVGASTPLTGIFKVIRDSNTSIRATLQFEELPKFIDGLGGNNPSCKLCEAFTNLQGREGRTWDIEVIALIFEELYVVRG